jgi:hypothetical protein
MNGSKELTHGSEGQIIHQRWAPTDERLWIEVFDSFNRQFANVMEQEDAQAALAKGLQLDKGDSRQTHHRV